MNETTFSNLGFGNPDKESLWSHVEKSEKLAILHQLYVARSVIGGFNNTNDDELKLWSEIDYGDIPEDIQPLLFLALYKNNFSADNVQNQISRIYD